MVTDRKFRVAQRSIIWANFGEADMRLRHGGKQARIDKITYLIIYQYLTKHRMQN